MPLHEGEGDHPIAIDLFWRTITDGERGYFRGELRRPGKQVVWTDPELFVGDVYEGVRPVAGDEYGDLTEYFDHSDIHLEVEEEGEELVRYTLTYGHEEAGRTDGAVAEFEGVLPKDQYDIVTANHFYLPGISGLTKADYEQ